jgi:hypothetical protein
MNKREILNKALKRATPNAARYQKFKFRGRHNRFGTNGSRDKNGKEFKGTTTNVRIIAHFKITQLADLYAQNGLSRCVQPLLG